VVAVARLVVVELIGGEGHGRRRASVIVREERVDEVVPSRICGHRRVRVVVEIFGDLLGPNAVPRPCLSRGEMALICASGMLLPRDRGERPMHVLAGHEVPGSILGGLDDEEAILVCPRPDLLPASIGAAVVRLIRQVNRAEGSDRRTSVALVAFIALVALLTFRAGRSLVALVALGALRSPWPGRSAPATLTLERLLRRRADVDELDRAVLDVRAVTTSAAVAPVAAMRVAATTAAMRPFMGSSFRSLTPADGRVFSRARARLKPELMTRPQLG
jgi:hypothetical protein